MNVRQIVAEDVGGLKFITNNCIAQLKYDGTQHTLHIKNGGAYALASRRVSVKTNQLSEKLDNFPKLKKQKFPFKKETIIVVETAAEHLKDVGANKRVNYVAGICNSNAEKVQDNELRFYAHHFLMLEGVKINADYLHHLKLLKKYFPSAGKYCEKVKLNDKKGVVYYIEPMPIGEVIKGLPINKEKLQIAVNKRSFKFEGYVIKDLHSTNMMKIKKINTADCIIIGYTSPTPNTKYDLNDWIGAIKVGVLVKVSVLAKKYLKKKRNYIPPSMIKFLLSADKIIDIGKVSGITEELREDISRNKNEYIGRVIEIAYMQWTGKKMFQPRFKRFREDKPVGKCTLKQFKG